MATQNDDIPGKGYGNTYVDSLIWGCGWTGGPITYWFGSGDLPAYDSSIGAFTGRDWTSPEQAAFVQAMANYSAVCNLTFAPAASQGEANIVWWLAPESAMGVGSLGLHEVPDASYSQIYGYFNYDDSSWDDLTQGGYGYITVIHELGHGMGLAHPHDGGGEADATKFPGVTGPWTTGTYGLNQGIWTVMSYNDGWSQAPSSSQAYGWEGSLMAFDIAALQALYGANMATRTGDDTYQLASSNGSGTFWSCIWDAGGSDTISNAGSSVACTINLNAAPLTGQNAGGYVSRDTGIIGGYTIANGVTIENAIGGSGADSLVGNSADNRLDGGAGNDTMTGGAGNDTYVINSQGDVITEANGGGTADWVESSITYTLTTYFENLQLTGSAPISGTGNGSNNTLVGNAGNNALNGGTGNDTVVGSAGVDQLTGGRGSDVFRFFDGDSGVGSGARDTVRDFKASDGDHIDLRFMDANELVDGLQHFTYIGTAAFGHHAGELRFSATLLAADTDGDGLADFEVTLAGVRGAPAASSLILA